MANETPDAHTVLSDPVLFSEWILGALVDVHTFEDDLRMAPSAEQCARLKISENERTQCANESVLLRALAAFTFVQRQGNKNYLMAFGQHLVGRVSNRMQAHAPSGRDPKTQEGFLRYLKDLSAKSPATEFCLTYMDRVYPECPNADGMFPNIPLELGFRYMLKHVEMTEKAAEFLGTGRLVIKDGFFKV